MVEEDGRLTITIEEYYRLFHGLNYPRNWNLLRFYLLTGFNYGGSTTEIPNTSDEYLSNIIRVGGLIHESYIRRRGPERFKREVLDGFKRGSSIINTNWLRRQLERLATEDESFSVEDNWKALGLEK